MYPNPQDVLPLPPRPDLDQYRTRAKELAAAGRSGEAAIQSWAREWIAALARLEPEAFRSARETERRTGQVAHFASERLRQGKGRLAQAQFVIARAHGFESWRRLVHHLGGLAEAQSGISAFERAAEAIVSGDLATLQRLIAADPALVRARSSREHRATLLHYVAANGVENYRQRTPANILSITTYLLEAGAEVDAEADVYGGGATTFGLAVTSAHPRQAGVQDALADLLLERGARMAPDIVRYCLANGCPEAAAHLAGKGARLDLVGAAGIGRLEVVRQAVEPPAVLSAKEAGAAIVMAAWYSQREVVALLLDGGVDPGAARGEDGQTALHVAAYQGDAPLVEMLLGQGAPLDVTDRVYGTPPMVWALHAWLEESRPNGAAYAAVLRALAAAGARVKREWLDDPRLRADAELHAALLRAAERT